MEWERIYGIKQQEQEKLATKRKITDEVMEVFLKDKNIKDLLLEKFKEIEKQKLVNNPKDLLSLV